MTPREKLIEKVALKMQGGKMKKYLKELPRRFAVCCITLCFTPFAFTLYILGAFAVLLPNVKIKKKL